MKITAVDFVKKVLGEAIRAKASDIHIDPFRDFQTVRFRIDGELVGSGKVPEGIYLEVIARIKILSSLRTDIHLAPQDGRFRFEECDIRVSVLPCQFGENAVLRILSSRNGKHSFIELGMSTFDIGRVRSATKRRQGLIVVTGPTGSGKTSTLYTLLHKLYTEDVSIVTLEDPIEYGMQGICQVQVNQQYGITFASGLRAILRQDPDIIMVGEIRDSETAKIAVHAALTGHLVLSTLHTNSASAAIPRLMDMGVEPYLISATLSLIIAQRLIRKNVPPGRIGIYETLVITEKIKSLIEKRSSTTDIEKESDMKKMYEDGIKKVEQGTITKEELLRTLFE
jgi:type II secretory ATPase GspE/PulE/Tfp pilus assembly ATPase PilB-like protein